MGQNITNVGFHGKPLSAVRRSEGPAWAPGGFNFFFLHFMNTTKVSNFSANVFVNTTKNLKNNQWIPGHKNKKIWVVFHEIQHWWYFGQYWGFLPQTTILKWDFHDSELFCYLIFLWDNVPYIFDNNVQFSLAYTSCNYTVKILKKWFLFCAGLILCDIYVHVALCIILFPENPVI